MHPDLRKINVRLAIAHVLDKDVIIDIHDGYAIKSDSPVWRSQSDYWYTPFAIHTLLQKNNN